MNTNKPYVEKLKTVPSKNYDCLPDYNEYILYTGNISKSYFLKKYFLYQNVYSLKHHTLIIHLQINTIFMYILLSENYNHAIELSSDINMKIISTKLKSRDKSCNL